MVVGVLVIEAHDWLENLTLQMQKLWIAWSVDGAATEAQDSLVCIFICYDVRLYEMIIVGAEARTQHLAIGNEAHIIGENFTLQTLAEIDGSYDLRAVLVVNWLCAACLIDIIICWHDGPVTHGVVAHFEVL